MADTLEVFGTTYQNVAGFKAKDSNGNVLTYTRGGGGGYVIQDQYGNIILPKEGDGGGGDATGGSGLYESGSIVIVSDIEVPTTGLLIPGIQLSFQPDIFEFWMDKDSYFAIAAPSNYHFYHIIFTKFHSTMPPQRYNSSTLYDWNTNGYVVSYGVASYTFSGSQNGYALNGWNTQLDPTYVDGFVINSDGTIKVRSTNNTLSFYAGTYHYVAYKAVTL